MQARQFSLVPSCLESMCSEHCQSYSGIDLESEKCTVLKLVSILHTYSGMMTPTSRGNWINIMNDLTQSDL